MKQIILLSDVTFDLVIKGFDRPIKDIISDYIYAETIPSALFSIEKKLKEDTLLIVHTDPYFHRYDGSALEEIIAAIIRIAQKFRGQILLSNFLFSPGDVSLVKGNAGQFENFMLNSADKFQELLRLDGVYFYDFRKVVMQIGLDVAYNFKTGFLYQMPYSKSLITHLGKLLVDNIRFLSQPEKKVILVDCDNTLWGGILGEDGLKGVLCNRNAGGVIYFHFQKFLLERKAEGFILGIISKNNEADVQEAFDKLGMPLKWDDFIVRKINWKNKADNIREVAGDLKLGLDSFIFIDDNEFEIQSVAAILPELETRIFSDNYNEVLILMDDFAFKRKRITTEDLRKTEQYLAEEHRNNLKASSSFEDYLESLDIRLDISINNSVDLPRLSQLTEKTNQFNFNKEIFSVSRLDDYIKEGNLVYSTKVADRFGDYGLVGLILVDVKDQRATVRNYLLSCRVLGRSVEKRFYEYVLNDLKERGIKLLDITFVQTPKNTPASEFLHKLRAR